MLYLFIGAVTKTSTNPSFKASVAAIKFYCIPHFIIVNSKVQILSFQRFKTLIFLEQFGLVCQFHEAEQLTLNSFYE
jgi:hypothetical protein